jgi:hypothetical protein
MPEFGMATATDRYLEVMEKFTLPKIAQKAIGLCLMRRIMGSCTNLV